MKRLRKSADWLQALCVALFREQGIALPPGGFQVRVFDATTVKEPGRTGSLWRLHYSVRLPSLACDFFKLTATEGRGTGERSRSSRSARATMCSLTGRALRACTMWCPQAVMHGAREHRGAVASHARRRAFDLLAQVTTLKRVGTVHSWPVLATGEGIAVPGRVCAIRKTQEATRLAQRKLRKEAGRKGKQVQPRTLEFARYVIVFTTFPEATFTAAEVLAWYRTRWQVELVFKRFKSLAQLGHLPKYDDESAKAWLYGKLLVALLVEKLIRHATSVSPWGYSLEAAPDAQRLA